MSNIKEYTHLAKKMFCSLPFPLLFKRFYDDDAVLPLNILDRFPSVSTRVIAPLNVIPGNSGPKRRIT